MAVEPIAEALSVVRRSVYDAVSPLAGLYSGHPKLYWLKAEQGVTFPYMVMQSQDNGGSDSSLLDLAGWEGLVTVKALAKTPSEAEALLAGVPAAMAALQADGFTITATLRRPLSLPPLDGVWQAGLIYNVTLYRS